MKILIPEAVSGWHRYYVLNGAGDVVQSEGTREGADAAAKICNDHELSNDRRPVYTVYDKGEEK